VTSRRSNRGTWNFRWDRILDGDEFHLMMDGWKQSSSRLDTYERPPRLKVESLSPIAHSRLAEKLDAELPEPYKTNYYRRKLKEWKTRTPTAEVEARKHLALALYRVTDGTRKRHVWCLLLGIDERRFARLKDEGKKLSLGGGITNRKE
jgi:hypothetical protein